MRSPKRIDFFLVRSIIFLILGAVVLFTFQLQGQMQLVGSPEEDSLRMAQLNDSDKPKL